MKYKEIEKVLEGENTTLRPWKEEERNPNVKSNYKDGIFRRLFRSEEEIIELYNALSGSNYPMDAKVEIVTLNNSIMGDLKNDLAFIIDNKLIVLIEHQSTITPNMPLRMLCYIGREYEKFYFSRKIYSKTRIMIPTPEFYVFYNGKEDRPLMETLKLSDSFVKKCDTIDLEVNVTVINVNYEKGAEILERCKTLREYSVFIHLIREKQSNGYDLKSAIEESIKECMENDVLREFLKGNGGDVVSFLFEELTRAECEAIREEDGYVRGLAEGERKGLAKGKAQGIAQGKAQGIAQGKVEGISEGKIATAIKMKRAGESIEKIALYTELEPEEIEKL